MKEKYKVLEETIDFQVSNYGSIKRICEGGRIIIKSPSKNNLKNNNAIRIRYLKDGIYKHKAVHQIVAKYFIPNPDNLKYVIHKDGNKKNNVYTNLEWVEFYNIPNQLK